jgi:hypothetical protein
MDVNTVGTLVIAVATSATTIIAWRAWRQQQADRQPVVELRHHWERDGSLTLWLTIRNRLGESMVVEEARVLRPRRARLTRERTRDELGGEAGFVRATAASIPLDWNVAPVGTPPATALDGRIRFGGTAANETIAMNVQFPNGWRGGQLKLALRLTSISAHQQRSRTKLRRSIPAPPSVA